MKSILEELFYGNICPGFDGREPNKEAKQLMKYIADHHDNLYETLTEKQRETLEKFDDCQAELTDINERELSYTLFVLERVLLSKSSSLKMKI